LGRWKIWEEVSEEVGKELAQVEVSFSREETLRGVNVKIKKSGLSFFLFFPFYFYFIFELFSFFYF